MDAPVRPRLTDASPAPVAGRTARAATGPAPWWTALVAAAGAVVVAVRDPHMPGSYGFCPVHALTGGWCPFCGALRATHDLLRGDLAGAWSMNPLWVLGLPPLAAAWLRWTLRGGDPAADRPGRAWPAWSVVGVVMAFGVLRNVPALAPWLAP